VWVSLAAAASLVVVLLAAVALHDPAPVWTAEAIEGASRLGDRPLAGPSSMQPAEWIETGPRARARLRAREVGLVDLEAGSRARLALVRPGEHRIELKKGTMRALVWAPPRVFFVETEAARASDLGCAYTLAVDEAGSGRLAVTAGWVELEGRGSSALVPAGASCSIRSGLGPGTPVFDDAGDAFRLALESLDSGATAEAREAALAAALACARVRDGLSLWHLLARVRPEERARVHDRLAALVPPPAAVTRERIVAGEASARSAWWPALGLGQPPGAATR